MRKEDCGILETWDYKGYNTRKINIDLFSTQKDWNQTLITMINKCSAQIIKNSMRGGADTIRVSPRMYGIFLTFEYFNKDTNMLSGKYKIIIDESLLNDEILVYNSDLYYRTTLVVRRNLGETNINENGEQETLVSDIRILTINECSEEEIIEYKRSVSACISVLNY